VPLFEVKVSRAVFRAPLEFTGGNGSVVLGFSAPIRCRKLQSVIIYGCIFLSMTQLDQASPTSVAELVREIAQALVDEPSAVAVESVSRDESTVLRLRVAPQDVGKVIGKQGRTARSVRTILGAVSMKLHRRYTLDILEEDE